MASQIAESNGEFCFDLYKELNPAGGNVFFSPLSIISALVMVLLGARGNTASQIQKALHFDRFSEFENLKHKGSQNVHSALEEVLLEIIAPSPNHTLHIANRLYAEQSYPVLKKYLLLAKKYYKAGLEKVDFQGSHEQARLAINAWVESQTNGLIKDLLASGSLSPNTILVIVNAIYFKGKWNYKFKEENTKEMPFRTHEKVNKLVKMMHQVAGFNIASIEEPKAQILELPYAGNEISMIILLPEDPSGLSQLESVITYKKLTRWMKSMRKRQVNVYLPRVKVEEQYQLSSILSGLGITDLFTPRANLSGISLAGNLAVSEVVHKAYVDVNEEGTEAAAATAVEIRTVSAPLETEFKADHPFLFCIREKNTDIILFLGKVSSP